MDDLIVMLCLAAGNGDEEEQEEVEKLIVTINTVCRNGEVMVGSSPPGSSHSTPTCPIKIERDEEESFPPLRPPPCPASEYYRPVVIDLTESDTDGGIGHNSPIKRKYPSAIIIDDDEDDIDGDGGIDGDDDVFQSIDTKDVTEQLEEGCDDVEEEICLEEQEDMDESPSQMEECNDLACKEPTQSATIISDVLVMPYASEELVVTERNCTATDIDHCIGALVAKYQESTTSILSKDSIMELHAKTKHSEVVMECPDPSHEIVVHSDCPPSSDTDLVPLIPLSDRRSGVTMHVQPSLATDMLTYLQDTHLQDPRLLRAKEII